MPLDDGRRLRGSEQIAQERDARAHDLGAGCRHPRQSCQQTGRRAGAALPSVAFGREQPGPEGAQRIAAGPGGSHRPLDITSNGGVIADAEVGKSRRLRGTSDEAGIADALRRFETVDGRGDSHTRLTAARRESRRPECRGHDKTIGGRQPPEPFEGLHRFIEASLPEQDPNQAKQTGGRAAVVFARASGCERASQQRLALSQRRLFDSDLRREDRDVNQRALVTPAALREPASVIERRRRLAQLSAFQKRAGQRGHSVGGRAPVVPSREAACQTSDGSHGGGAASRPQLLDRARQPSPVGRDITVNRPRWGAP